MEDIFGQIVNITKAGAYDALAPKYAELQEENNRLRERVEFLEKLINEYTLKMKANLSGGKVDSFLKDQVIEDKDDLKELDI